MYRLTELSTNPNMKKTSQDYRIMRRYEVCETTVVGTVTRRLKGLGTNISYVAVDELFAVIHTEHLSVGQGAHDISNNKISQMYGNLRKEVIQLYVDMCETYSLNKRKVRKSLVVKPIISNAMNSRCQIDLIDMQPNLMVITSGF